MAASHKIEFIPNPTQKAFIESRADADLFSSRVGEGKSAGLVWACYYHTSWNAGATWALIRDTWENMQATTQKEFFKWFPPGVMGEYRSSTRTFHWGERTGLKGEVQFLGMDDPQDASKLQSRELAGFGIDEPAPAAESGGVSEMIFDVALSRLRASGMKWYAAKLAQNNPDETHWSYKRFVVPGTAGFTSWQTKAPENTQNLPPGYYEKLAGQWEHRPDLKRRFLEGKFGFQQVGKSVTPEWRDEVHLCPGLTPIPKLDLILLWDGGLNPTCVITQVTPLGRWHILEAHVGDGIGMIELVADVVRPALAARYPRMKIRHTGDPNLSQREQSNAQQSALRIIRQEIGGPWRPGPVAISERVEPLRAVLNRAPRGEGIVQVEPEGAKPVWHALRGGWHYHVARTGLVGTDPEKDVHSHPGDCMGYGAAWLFPLGKLRERRRGRERPQTASFFQTGTRGTGPLGMGRPDIRMPKEGRVIGGTGRL